MYILLSNLSIFSKFLHDFLFGGGGVEIRIRQGLHTPCVDKTLILISTGGVVLMSAIF